MSERNQLRVGDRSRRPTAPHCDLDQREREIAAGNIHPDSTAPVIERIIAANSVVTIDRFGEFGARWLDTQFDNADGINYHSLTILDNASASDGSIFS